MCFNSHRLINGRIGSLRRWLVNLDIASSPQEGVSEEDAARNRRLRDHFFEVFNVFVPGTDVKFSSVDRKTWRVRPIDLSELSTNRKNCAKSASR